MRGPGAPVLGAVAFMVLIIDSVRGVSVLRQMDHVLNDLADTRDQTINRQDGDRGPQPAHRSMMITSVEPKIQYRWSQSRIAH